LKLTILYDDESNIEGLKCGHGFSCLIESGKTPGILFDTGGNGSILIHNMKKLGINPTSVEEIYISHNHWDHLGGLAEFLRINKRAKVYVPPSVTVPEVENEVIVVSQPTEIHNGVYSTGEIPITGHYGGIGGEQSLGIMSEKGIVAVAGCSHPGVRNILNTLSRFGKITALVGGLHGFTDFDVIKDMDLICATHCTKHKAEIRNRYPEKSIYGGVGTVIEIKD